MYVWLVSGYICCSVKFFVLRSLVFYLFVIGSSSLIGFIRIRMFWFGWYGLIICDEFDSILNGEMVIFG